jgi:hypothetical protein
MSDVLYKLQSETIDAFKKILDKKSLPVKLTIEYLGDSKQKTMIKLSRINPKTEFLYGKQLMVSINEDLFDKFDKTSCNILFEQEIDKLSVNMESGKLKLKKLKLNTSIEILNKYGIEKVATANQLEEITISQQEDALTDAK